MIIFPLIALLAALMYKNIFQLKAEINQLRSENEKLSNEIAKIKAFLNFNRSITINQGKQ